MLVAGASEVLKETDGAGPLDEKAGLPDEDVTTSQTAAWFQKKRNSVYDKSVTLSMSETDV